MESQLRIYFGSTLSNLYAVGYLSTDLHKLITLSEAIEEKEGASDIDDIGNWFNYTNRYTRALEKYSRSSTITHARDGSLVLLLAGMAVATSIIVPIAIARAQERLQKEGLRVQFEVSPTDEVLDRHIKRYERGEYGTGVGGLNNLFGTLSGLGYDVRGVSDHTYLIHRAINVCAKRIVKTVRYAATR